MNEALTRPEAETGEAVYSNFDHQLEAKIAAQLAVNAGALCAQHAAWNFCGYVWQLPDGRWVDQVWCYGSPVENVVGDTLLAAIEQANESYGSA